MDRHAKWLRRRIVASVVSQTALTFAIIAVVVFILLQWRTNAGLLTALFASVVVGQLVALARVAFAMKRNTLDYKSMRRYVDIPFTFRVSRFHGLESAHPVAERLPGFEPIATIRDSAADPEPIFDIFHDPSRLVAASVDRATGEVSLISSLRNDRILVTNTILSPPHERLVMSLASSKSIDSVIDTHRRAISARSDVVELASSAHQVVLESLAIEHESYVTVGAFLSPFLDLNPTKSSWARLTARIESEEFIRLPTRLGPDFAPSDRGSAPDNRADAVPSSTAGLPSTPEPPVVTSLDLNVPQVIAPEMVVPEVIAPEMVVPEMVAPEMVVPEVIVPQMTEPTMAQPTPVAPDVVVPDLASAVEPVADVSEAFPSVQPITDSTLGHAPDTVGADEPSGPAPLDLSAAIASLETDSAIDEMVSSHEQVAEPIAPVAADPLVAPVAAVAPVANIAAVVAPDVAPVADVVAPVTAEPAPVPAAAVADLYQEQPLDQRPLSVPVRVPAPVTSYLIAPPGVVADSLTTYVANERGTGPDDQNPAAMAAPVAVPVVEVAAPPVVAAPTDSAPAEPPAAEPLPAYILQAPPESFADDIVSADTPASAVVPSDVGWPSPSAPADDEDDEPMLVPDLNGALGRSEELVQNRPRLSEVIRANTAPPPTNNSGGRRSRRKPR